MEEKLDVISSVLVLNPSYEHETLVGEEAGKVLLKLLDPPFFVV